MIQEVQNIKISEFDYPLPEERIAKYPLAQRDASKLLLCHNGSVSQGLFSDIATYLPKGTLLVFNDTKVIQARIRVQKESGAVIELFCLEPWKMPVAKAFEEKSSVLWKCLIGNNKRWKTALLEKKVIVSGREIRLAMERIEPVGDAWVVRFSWDSAISFAEILESAGEMPLPPYLHRKAEERDKERYQTVYAHIKGSVAAPTAGLHFTEKVFEDLQKAGIEKEFITLHVGAGTFKPVSSQLIGEHIMHTEQIILTKEQLLHFYNHLGKPLVAVGTTCVRTIESLYWYGVQLMRGQARNGMHISQWYPYMQQQSLPDAKIALESVLEQMEKEGKQYLEGDTQLMIVPSYKYNLINGMVTNFHQPKSTLLLLVSAFIGDAWKEAYRYALEHDFRFLSYGDSCLFY